MADVIIVLGRGIAQDGSLPLDPLARVERAAELYKAGAAPIIAMSGGYNHQLESAPTLTEAAAMKAYAVSLGVPPEAILEEGISQHTVANAYALKKLIFEPHGYHDIILVASDEHMPRSLYVFGKVLGPAYSITPAVSRRVLSEEEYQKELDHEAKSMAVAKSYLENVAAGDDQNVRELALSINPNDPIKNI